MLDSKKQLEMKRLVIHLFLGISIMFLAVNFRYTQWLLFSLIAIGLIISLISVFVDIPVFAFLLDRLEKQKYRRTFPGKGLLFFLAGCLIVLRLFPISTALAAIAILTFGDATAHARGIFGKVRHKKPFDIRKSVEGTVLGTIVGTFFAAFFVPLLYAFTAALFAMVAEVIAIRLGQDSVDDNVIVPFVAGMVIFLISKI